MLTDAAIAASMDTALPAPMDTAAPTDVYVAPPRDTAPPPPDVRQPPQTPPAPPLGMGAIAYWPFDEGSGTTILDAAGGKHDGAPKGGTVDWVDGKHSFALHLPKGTWVEVPGSDAFNAIDPGPMTVAAWVYPITIDATGYAFAVSQQEGMTDYEIFGLGFQGGKAMFDIHVSIAGAADMAPTNVWMHLAGVYDGTTMHLYVNGVEAGTYDKAGYMFPADTNPILIGANSNYENNVNVVKEFFDGYVDDLRLYSRALSATEVAALAN